MSSVGWQVTLCDPIWHVSSRSGEAGYTANCYIRIVYFTFRDELTTTRHGVIHYNHLRQCYRTRQTASWAAGIVKQRSFLGHRILAATGRTTGCIVYKQLKIDAVVTRERRVNAAGVGCDRSVRAFA